MYKFKYGEFNNSQIEYLQTIIRKKIFFLILCLDPKTKSEYKNVNVEVALNSLLTELGGLNQVLFYPKKMGEVISLLEATLIEIEKSEYDFSSCRRLLLDAGVKVSELKEAI